MRSANIRGLEAEVSPLKGALDKTMDKTTAKMEEMLENEFKALPAPPAPLLLVSSALLPSSCALPRPCAPAVRFSLVACKIRNCIVRKDWLDGLPVVVSMWYVPCLSDRISDMRFLHQPAAVSGSEYSYILVHGFGV